MNTDDLPEAGRLIRPRINALLEKAAQKPLTIVCAGAGYGKSWAVRDFAAASGPQARWLQLSASDNAPELINTLTENGGPEHRRLTVLDDFHLITEPSILRFIEAEAASLPKKRAFILICREYPRINIAGLQAGGNISFIHETDLAFTENELSLYFQKRGLTVSPQGVHDVTRDIGGWPLALKLAAESLDRAQDYSGQTAGALRNNIFTLMERQAFAPASEKLQRFLARVSLLAQFPAGLLAALAGGDESLLAEFRRQNAYIRYDPFTDAYLIQPLFLGFLRARQDILTEEEKNGTYVAAAEWCRQHDLLADALEYCEKTGDYGTVTAILTARVGSMPQSLALCAAGIFERMPGETPGRVGFLAAVHLYVLIRLGRWRQFTDLAPRYGQIFSEMQEDNVLRDHTLAGICYFRGVARAYMSTIDDRYDFDAYYAKAAEYLMKTPRALPAVFSVSPGAWAGMSGAVRVGAPHEYTEAAARQVKCLYLTMGGVLGYDNLCRGELAFYQDDIQTAEGEFVRALNYAQKNDRHEFADKANFYLMRIAALQGRRTEAEQALNHIAANENFIIHDIAAGWYHSFLRQPENIPDWLKGAFEPYAHPNFIENFGNQIKARFHFMAKNFAPLLTYIDEMKSRESVLYGRVELLATEACARYLTRDTAAAFEALRGAYEAASPNEIIMPFIELGKDMRTLTLAAMRGAGCGVPEEWLELINKKAHLYAKYQAIIISDAANGAGGEDIALSPREAAILHDLYAGLSRTDIATKQELSVNTVNMNIRHIYTKLHAKNIADIIRIAAERKLV